MGKLIAKGMRSMLPRLGPTAALDLRWLCWIDLSLALDTTYNSSIFRNMLIRHLFN